MHDDSLVCRERPSQKYTQEQAQESTVPYTVPLDGLSVLRQLLG